MKQGRDFGKPKLDRLDVMRVLNISRTTLWRLEKAGKLVPPISIRALRPIRL